MVPLLTWHVHILLPLCLAGTPDSAFLLPIIHSLVAQPVLSAWSLANQYFIKPISMINLYSVREDSTASELRLKKKRR